MNLLITQFNSACYHYIHWAQIRETHYTYTCLDMEKNLCAVRNTEADSVDTVICLIFTG
jgi:hypothetical protein